MSDRPAIQALSVLMQSGQANPKVRTERLVPAAIYDLDYRTFVIAGAFEIHAKALPPFGRRIHATKLKLLQFVAIRPWLLPVMEAWGSSEKEEEPSFSTQDVRRGFLGDRMYDAVVAFLVARGTLEWRGSHLAAGLHAERLSQLYAGAVANELFAAERKALNDLTRIKITIRMLEGL